jgi:hypothetical protein
MADQGEGTEWNTFFRVNPLVEVTVTIVSS